MYHDKRFIIELGRYQDLNQTKDALAVSECHIHPLAEPMLQQVAWDGFRRRTYIQLRVVSVESLGLPRGGPLASVYKHAENRGLGLCPAEVGHLLRLSFVDQRSMKLLYIAMHAIELPSGNSFAFVLARGFGGLLLYSDFSYPHTHMHADDELVFVEL